ncbi:Serine/threonine-protein kinase PknB [Planctomycetes bacterium Pla163]|uniref:Serine/threonine-protein kinase PknB n=1 Tax=Rohdeia mirabilis TaxID=2528008 RepID=A0A518CVB4_9BACT|nr:Serine/threonine-protein kinase PknB [Planctomycetes bacterium Pla163]
MSTDRHTRAREILADVQHLPAARRETMIERACGDDAELLREVRALAGGDGAAGAPVPAAGPPGGPAAEVAGQRIDHYILVEPIGEGGMGTVWLAEQTEPVQRNVALKIIKLGMDTREVIARFAAERQALAVMDHPNIAKVLDAGATDGGRPYFVMEYIEGVPIVEHCDRAQLDTTARLELFTEVCGAIQHAHQKGLVHRDIKPSNVLVALQDGAPVPKVIDFGIAKATEGDGDAETLLTQVGQVIGTPAYMAPEQAERGGLDIDTRADIYSLGVLLYELLTGTTPFDIATLVQSGYDEMMRAIREVEPPKPSTRLSSLGETGTRTAQLRRVGLKELRSQLSGDLDWIVMRCLEKDRERRYESATALAEDVRRHLADEPVTAGPPSARYRFAKFVKRNRAQVVAAAIVLVVLVAGMVGTTWGLVWALDERDRADAAATQAQLATAAEAEQRAAAQESERRAVAEAERATLAREAEAEQRAAAQESEARAVAEAERATQAEAEALARAEELETVAAFQTAQLNGIDVQAMGAQLREALLAAVPEAERPAFDAALAPINFSNIALGTIEKNVLERSYMAIQRELVGQPRVRARMLRSLAVTFAEFGLPQRSLGPLQQVVEIWREHGAEDESELLLALSDMGASLADMDRTSEADVYIREAVEIARRTRDADDPQLLQLLGTHGVLLSMLGDFEAAEDLLRAAYAGLVETTGPESLDSLWALTSLGNVLSEVGALEEAEELLRAAYELHVSVLGESDPSTLLARIQLAHVLLYVGEEDEAEQIYREVYEARRLTHGDDHLTTLNALYNYAQSFMRRGDFAGAQELLVEVLEAQRRTLGDTHWMTLKTLEGLGDAAVKLGRWDDALRHRREVYDTVVEVDGPESEPFFYAAHDLLKVLEDHGSPAEALELATFSYESARATLDPTSAMIYAYLASRGRSLLRLERYEEAVEALTESYEAMLEIGGPDDWQTKDAAWSLAATYDSWDLAEPGQGYRKIAEEWAELGDD